MQIKNALLDEIEKDQVLCINIELEDKDTDDISRFSLPVGFTEHLMMQFLESVDMTHKDRLVDGTIWFKDGSWARLLYDWDKCYASWERYRLPPIPEDLR